jgi:DNA-binding XRE family transcriptional regulator
MATLTSTPSESQEASATQPAAVPAGVEAPSIERMARLRRLVRQDGMDAEAAAREIGVDPIIAQLWLRLPDDLWPTASDGADQAAGEADRAPRPMGPPAHGLRRVLTCRIPQPAYDRLRAGDQSTGAMGEAATAALEAGLAMARPAQAPGGWRFPRRPLAVALPAEDYARVMQLAQEAFAADPRDAAGWLIARGLGMMLPLPTPEELSGAVSVAPAPVAMPERLPAPVARFVLPPRRRPEVRTPLPADDSAPSGDELRQRRESIGISQRDLAAASGLSRGLVAEVERGRRRHVLTRLRLSETLASLERTRPAAAGGSGAAPGAPLAATAV